MIRPPTAALLATVMVASPVAAKSLTAVPLQIDPAKAYVLVEIAPATEKAPAGSLVFARYDEAKGDVRGLGRAKDAALAGKASPREATGKPLVKDGKRRLYLLELEPDFWIVEGANGTAFSLGSTGVRLVAGSVTDLGVARVTSDYGEGDAPEKLTAGKLAKVALLGPFGGSIKPKPVPAMVEFTPRSVRDIPVPTGLQSRITSVAWSPPVKFGNYLGGLVNRMGGRKARPGAATVSAAP